MRLPVFAAILLTMSALPAYADTAPRLVDHARIALKDVIADAPESDASLDVGAAPPPGGSVLLTPEALASRLGDRASFVRLPTAPVRITSASRVLTARQLAELVQPAVAGALRPGVSLVRVDATVGATLSPRTVVKSVTLPRLHQKGTQRATAMVELARDGETQLRMPIAVTLEVDERGTRADVPRGTKLTVVVRHGSVEIHADGTAMTDGDVGDTIQVTIARTGRVAHAHLTGDTVADLVDRS